MRRVRIFWCVPGWWGVAEGCLAAAAFLLVLLPTMSDAPAMVITMFAVLLSAACGGWAALRIRPDRVPGLLVCLGEGARAAALAAGLLGLVYGILATFGLAALFRQTLAGEWGMLFYLGLTGPGYLLARLVSFGLWRWDRLRRRRFVWGLTHAILSVVGMMGVLVLSAGLLYAARVDQINLAEIPPGSLFGRIVMWLFTLLLFAILAALLGVAILALPAFGFSFWVARRITSRLDRLTRATDALREDDLSARVVVEGEDEVARLQENFNRMAARLEASTQALQAERDKVAGLLEVQRELIAGVSHELRTPAATILGHVDALRRQDGAPFTEAVTHDLDVIAHEAGRLRTILNDLLTLAQSESSRLSLNLEPVNLTALIRQAVQTLAPLAWASKRVEVSAEGLDDLPAALADAGRVEQILLNLIQNAIRHTPPGGVVVLSAGAQAGQIWLEVADTGAGIEARDLPHIWEKFYRADGTPGNENEGVGLGLALVRELSQAMGGHVTVESVAGEGSVFRVSLPAA